MHTFVIPSKLEKSMRELYQNHAREASKLLNDIYGNTKENKQKPPLPIYDPSKNRFGDEQ